MLFETIEQMTTLRNIFLGWFIFLPVPSLSLGQTIDRGQIPPIASYPGQWKMSTTHSTERDTTAAFPALRLTAFAGVSATSRRDGDKQKQCGEILGSRLGCRARLSILEAAQRESEGF